MPDVKRILCYGDSNTWGYDPTTGRRYARDVRWTGVLQRALGEDFEIIEEGLNGRTTVLEDRIEPGRNGLTYLYPCLLSHFPLDLVVIMLGTNDLKARFNLPAGDIAEGARQLVLCVRHAAEDNGSSPPPVLLVCPPRLGKIDENNEEFAGAGPKSRKLSGFYATVAGELGCFFLDAGQYITSSDIDGIHLDAAEHRKLGEAVATKIKSVTLA